MDKEIKNHKTKKSLLVLIKDYFKFDSHQAIFKKEIIGGISTFLAMCYILAVNPGIVGTSVIDPNNPSLGTASQYSSGLFLATAISSCLGTLLMGLWARVPIAVAPGMGLNAFFAYTVASAVGFESALTVTILSGILYFIIALTPVRGKISQLIPKNFKIAIGTGIGFFITYIGLKNSQIIVTDPNGLVSALGDFKNPLVITAALMILLGLILHFAKVPAATIITMLVGAIIVMILCLSKVVVPYTNGPNGLEIAPNFGLLGKYSDFSSFEYVVKAGWIGFSNVEMWKNPVTYVGVLSFLYMDFFDTTGSIVVIDNMIDFGKKDPNWIKKVNYVDSVCTIGGAAIGSTTVTTFVESTVGIGSGARTGFSSLIVALLFGLSIALWPIMNVFLPITDANNVSYQPVTSPALVIVGALMISQIRYFEWEIFADIPMLFITIISMMLTNSIAHGISFGVIIFVIMNAALGLIQKIRHRKKVINDLSMPSSEINNNLKTREFNYWKRINWLIFIIAIIGVAYIVLEQVLF